MPHTLEKASVTEGPVLSPLAGKPAPQGLLIDVAQLEKDYYERKPDLTDPSQLVSFGTSGHRGSPLHGSFNAAHIAAITQAICDYRGRQSHLADGIVITPSHNPPEDGGFKYNPPHGGPADLDVTDWVQTRANELLRTGNT